MRLAERAAALAAVALMAAACSSGGDSAEPAAPETTPETTEASYPTADTVATALAVMAVLIFLGVITSRTRRRLNETASEDEAAAEDEAASEGEASSAGDGEAKSTRRLRRLLMAAVIGQCWAAAAAAGPLAGDGRLGMALTVIAVLIASGVITLRARRRLAEAAPGDEAQ